MLKVTSSIFILLALIFTSSIWAKNNNVLFGQKINQSQQLKFSEAKSYEITNSNFPEVIENLNFEDAELITVIRAISKLTGKNFIIDPAVSKGKITIIAPSPMTVAQAYRVFLSALAMNNYTVVPIPNTNVVKVRRVQDAITDSIEFYGDH